MNNFLERSRTMNNRLACVAITVLVHSLCNNLPTTPVHDMAVHPRDNELVI